MTEHLKECSTLIDSKEKLVKTIKKYNADHPIIELPF
jgi:hypothetical protein